MNQRLQRVCRNIRRGCLAVIVLQCLLCTGCVINPGAEVREALSQTKTYEWSDTGSIRVHGIGPQEEAFTMGEGVIVLNEDGTINLLESRLTHYLRSEPSADEAMAGLTAILLANIEQSKAFYASLETTLGMVQEVVGLLRPRPPPADESETSPVP